MNIIQVYNPTVYLYEHTGNHVASLSSAYEEKEKILARKTEYC